MASKLVALLVLGALVHSSIAAPSNPRHFSVPARRARTLHDRSVSHGTAPTDEHVVIDFVIGGQTIPVSVDTGSSFFWAASTLITDAKVTSSLPALFNPNISKTYRDENDPADAYNCGGDPNVCVMGLDTVQLVGTRLVAKDMAFGVASKMGENVFASGQSATMGMGRQPGDTADWLPRDQTFWYRTGADFADPYVFAVDLYSDRVGTWDFGFIDPAKYTGEIAYGHMDTSIGNWNFEMTGFAIGGRDVVDVTPFRGVVDTGGPNMGLPKEIVRPYFASFGGFPSNGNSHNFPCNQYPPPDLVLVMATGDKLVLDSTWLVESGTSPWGNGTCKGRVDDSVQGAYNIGASVIDQKFVVFDHAHARVGFADKKRGFYEAR